MNTDILALKHVRIKKCKYPILQLQKPPMPAVLNTTMNGFSNLHNKIAKQIVLISVTFTELLKGTLQKKKYLLQLKVTFGNLICH